MSDRMVGWITEPLTVLSAVEGVGLPPGSPVTQDARGKLKLAEQGDRVVGAILSAEAGATITNPPPDGYSYANIDIHRCHAAVWML